MKTIDFLCASEASTAISPPSAAAAAATAGRAIDRHNPLISDGKRITSRSFPNIPPCSSQHSPINPLPYHQLAAAAEIGSGGSATHKKKIKKADGKKSSSIISADIVRWSCGKPSDLATPPGSMRYLLNDKSFRDGSMDRIATSILSTQTNKKEVTNSEILECKTSPPSNQIVVLRVSLHCRGCEGKLRKHLSKMEGVNSFTIDFAAKKVTIMGNITPQGVLESVAKVKNAQFWPSLPTKP